MVVRNEFICYNLSLIGYNDGRNNCSGAVFVSLDNVVEICSPGDKDDVGR